MGRGDKSVDELNPGLGKYGWGPYGDYNGSHLPARFKCLKCGDTQEVMEARGIRTAECKDCDKHICLKCGKGFTIPNNKGHESTRRFCYGCLPYGTSDRIGGNMYHRLWVGYVPKQIKDKYGTSCSICGYNKSYAALESHHTDMESKGFPPAGLIYSPAGLIYSPYDLGQIFKELDKCILVCANCHGGIRHPGQNNIDYE